MDLTTSNTAIVLDSTADYPDASDDFANWRVVPLYVNFGDDSYRDGVDLAGPEFYARLPTTPSLPTTSQPTPRDFVAAYRELGEYARIYSLHIGATFSGTYQSAVTAAAELGDDRVRPVDTETASVAITMLGLAIQRRLDRGTTDEEIDELIGRYKREHRLLFTVDTLEFLARGGRIGRAAAFAGDLLNVKPILTIRDGEVVPVKRVRGNRKAFQEFVDAVTTETADGPTAHFGTANANASERADQLAKMIRHLRPHADLEVEALLGAVIGTHAGPGAVALFWFTDSV
ncbi:MAG TPA: DegV family protein [Gaiellaceae bacterium]|nr:DegV family protein [Gaiellaceae bacterium]